MGDLQIILEMYPELKPRQAIIAAERAGLITRDCRDLYLQDYPDQPVVEEVIKPKYTLKECRETFDIFANKCWADMESQEIDAVLDTYDPEMKAKAIAYLRMRGYALDDGD